MTNWLRCARRSGAAGTGFHGPGPSVLRPGQGAMRIAANTRSRSRFYDGRQHAQAPADALRRRCDERRTEARKPSGARPNCSRAMTVPGMQGARSDLHSGPAARRIDLARTDPGQHSQIDGTLELPNILALAHRLRGRQAGPVALSAGAARPAARTARGDGPRLYRKHPHPPQGRAVLHRQDAEQFPPYRADPSDPAQCEDHRCAPRADGLLLLLLQATVRRGAGVHLWPDRDRPLLRRLCRR